MVGVLGKGLPSQSRAVDPGQVLDRGDPGRPGVFGGLAGGVSNRAKSLQGSARGVRDKARHPH